MREPAWEGAVLLLCFLSWEKRAFITNIYNGRDIGSKSVIFFYENCCKFLQRASTFRIQFPWDKPILAAFFFFLSLFLVTPTVIIQIFETLWACSSPLELQLCSWTRLFSSYPAWNSWVGWEEPCSLWSSSTFLKPSFLQLQWTISVQQVPSAELKTLWFAESEWKPGSTNGALSGGSVPLKPALAWLGIHPY